MKKLQKLVGRVFFSISRFCFNEASANLSASADVFVLAVENNPYQYFECLNVLDGHFDSDLDRNSVLTHTSLAITPDGQRLVSGDWFDDTIKIWNLNTGELLSTLEACVHCVAITPDGQTLVSGCADSTIKIWDLNSNELLHSLHCSEPVYLVAITPDGQKLISIEDSKIVQIWDLSNPEILKNLVTYSSGYSYFYWRYSKCIVISPDQQRIIMGRKIIKSYDLITGKLRTIIGRNLGQIYDLAITPDGKTLISSYDKNTIKIWDLTAKKYPEVRLTLKSYAETVEALTLTPDGQRIVSAGYRVIKYYSSYECFIEIWDLNTGEKLHSIKEYFTSDSCNCYLAITPDGKKIISSHGDGTIRIWGIPELSM
ncbi:MAG: WD40 repeat domain-containing protein [Microcoleus sp.]